jgi:hypothetical protein
MIPEKVIDELLAAVLASGVAVRELKPASDGSGPRGGLVRLNGRPVLFLETGSEPGETLRLLVEALNGADLDSIFLSPAARAAIEHP